MALDFSYSADGDTLLSFMADQSFVRGVRGPIGSGKSVACVAELFKQALMQEPCFDPATVTEHTLENGETEFRGERTGWRRVKTGVVRNTSPELESTTMATWLEWLPEDKYGKVRWRPPFRQRIIIPEMKLHWEIWFLALDRPEDVKKLLSFEFTNIWLNEARELPREVVTAAISRVRRFPRKIDGGATHPFIIMDTNAPDDDHWWSIMSGDAEPPEWMSDEDRLTLVKPDNWRFFTQPPAMFDVLNPDGSLKGYELNPDRDNRKFTDHQYYIDLIRGQSRSWIKNMVQNKIGSVVNGRPVYQGFSERYHKVAGRIEPDPAEPIYIGVDFGLTPAAAFLQDVHGQVRVIDELVTKDTHTETFAKLLAKHIRKHYADYQCIIVGDPRGDDRQPNQKDEKMTAFRIFRNNGVKIRPAKTNDPLIRQGAVQNRINTMDDGRPCYVIGENCKYLLKGKEGSYCYKKDTDEINKKSIFTHVADGEQYAVVEMGYGNLLVKSKTHGVTSKTTTRSQNIHERQRQTRSVRRLSKILSRGR